MQWCGKENLSGGGYASCQPVLPLVTEARDGPSAVDAKERQQPSCFRLSTSAGTLHPARAGERAASEAGRSASPPPVATAWALAAGNPSVEGGELSRFNSCTWKCLFVLAGAWHAAPFCRRAPEWEAASALSRVHKAGCIETACLVLPAA